MNRKRKNITDKNSFEQAGKDLLRKVHEQESQEQYDILSSWENIESYVYRKEVFTKRYRLLFSSVAASIVILIGIGVYFSLIKEKEEDFSMMLSLLDEEISFSEANEITVIEKNNRILLKDESSIQYDSVGRSNLEEQAIKKEVELAVLENKPQKEEKEELNQIVVPKGRRANITFSDGTKMYVNAGTRVIYPAVFGKNKREILVEGEVYLDVKEDKTRPFIVKTTGFDVKVLGTQFNVCAYKEDATVSVVLVGGKVEVETVKNESLTLSPNQLFEIKDGILEVKDVDVYEYICWKDNTMVLNDKILCEIVERLSRYYGRTILCDENISDLLISGKLDLRENVEDVVNNICQSLFLRYEMDEFDNLQITK